MTQNGTECREAANHAAETTCAAEEKSRLQMPGAITEKPRLAMLLAAPYSGATLFSIILDRHSRIACGGEIFPFSRNSPAQCSCGKRHVECEYYREVAAHMLNDDKLSFNRDLFIHTPRYNRHPFPQRILSAGWSHRRWYALRRAVLRTIPSVQRTEEEFVAAQARFVANCLQWKDAAVYVDGTKAFPRAELLAQSGKFQMRTIHLIRDGRAFCNSYIKNQKLGPRGAAKAARIWMKHVRETRMLHQLFPQIPSLQVRYEDVCRDFTKTMQAVCEFLGVPWEEGFQKRADAPSHVRGNRMRDKFDGTIREDLSWREQLGTAEIARLNAKMQSELRYHAYLD